MKKILEMMKPTVSILHQFLDYMEEFQPLISSRKLVPSKDTCYELSHLLQDYRQYDKPNYTLERYPLIHFLFRFSKEIQLLQYDVKTKHYIQGANATQFKKLSITSQYCVMITYMFTAFDDGFYDTLMFSDRKCTGITIRPNQLIQEKNIYVYFDFFQLIKGINKERCNLSAKDLIKNKIAKKNYPYTELGKCFLSLSEQVIDDLNPYMPSNMEDDATYERKQDRAVNALWKEFQIEEPNQSLFFRRRREDCIYELQLTLHDTTWLLSAGSHVTLERLHIAIQKAAHFDSDHLYYFMIDEIGYYHEACGQEQRFACQYTLGECNLCKKKHFIYFFDFGASWKFDIFVKDVQKNETNSEIRLIEQTGKIPEQYDDNWY